jgi:hypothetical protein
MAEFGQFRAEVLQVAADVLGLVHRLAAGDWFDQLCQVVDEARIFFSRAAGRPRAGGPGR